MSLQEEQKRRLRLEEVKKDAMRKAREFSDVFESVEGKRVLKELQKEFDPSVLATGEDNSTIIRAAQRDVVRWVEEVINRGKDYDLED